MRNVRLGILSPGDRRNIADELTLYKIYNGIIQMTLTEQLQKILALELRDKITFLIHKLSKAMSNIFLRFSGHNLTITNMLNTFGIFEVAKIHLIFIVLKFIFLNIFCSNRFYRRMGDVFYFSCTNLMKLRTFKFFTKKTPKTKVKPMKIPNCGVKCALDDLYKLYGVFPSNVRLQC